MPINIKNCSLQHRQQDSLRIIPDTIEMQRNAAGDERRMVYE
jgi:hypothetical protein